MKSLVKLLSTAFAVSFSFVLFLSCEEELTTIGEGVIGDEPFSTGVAEYDVFVSNEAIEAVQTNRLPLYQLGSLNNPIFGKTEANITTQVLFANNRSNPTFGDWTQATEDGAETDDDDATIVEEEEIEKITLYIPYQLVPDEFNDADNDGVLQGNDIDDNDPNSDSDGDGVTDFDEVRIGSDPLNPNQTGEEEGFVGNVFPRRFALDSIYGDIDSPFRLTVQRSTFFLII